MNNKVDRTEVILLDSPSVIIDEGKELYNRKIVFDISVILDNNYIIATQLDNKLTVEVSKEVLQPIEVSNTNTLLVNTINLEEIDIEGQIVLTQDIENFYTKQEADERFVNVSGDVMTGPLILYDDPQYDYEAATKHYVDNSLVITRDMLVNNQNKLLAVNNDGTGISFIGIIDCGTY